MKIPPKFRPSYITNFYVNFGMYIYVTSNVNNGHKIGVTDDLLKRKIQYNTIFPDLEFLITIFSQDAIFIEKSFKDRFLLYRKFSGNSDRRSEIYTLYLKIIAEHIIRCHHATGKALLIPSNHLEAEYYNQPYQGSTTYYLSNHYFVDRNNLPYIRNAGISERLNLGTIYHRENKGKWGWLLQHLQFKGFRKSIKDIEKKSKKFDTVPVPIEEWEQRDSFGNQEEIFFEKYFDALNYLQEQIFIILLEEKVIKRPFDLNKINQFKKMRGFIYQPKAYYHENIFFGKRLGHTMQTFSRFNLGINDERRKNVRRDIHFPKELVKYGKGWDEC